MGGCASRPQVLIDEFDAPVPLPSPQTAEEDSDMQEEVTKDVVVVEFVASVRAESQFGDVDEVDEIPSVREISIQDEMQSSEEVKEQTFGLPLSVEITETPEPETWLEKTIVEVKEVREVSAIDDAKSGDKTEEVLEFDFAIDHSPEPENETEDDLIIAEDKSIEIPQVPLEEKIEEKQIITHEKPQEETKTEEEETTDGSKKQSGPRKQFWPIAALLKTPLGSFAKPM